MNTKPVYLKSDPFRVIYVANGLWQLQQDTGMKGQNYFKGTKVEPKRDHFDRWQSIRRPMTREEAIAALNGHDTSRQQT